MSLKLFDCLSRPGACCSGLNAEALKLNLCRVLLQNLLVTQSNGNSTNAKATETHLHAEVFPGASYKHSSHREKGNDNHLVNLHRQPTLVSGSMITRWFKSASSHPHNKKLQLRSTQRFSSCGPEASSRPQQHLNTFTYPQTATCSFLKALLVKTQFLGLALIQHAKGLLIWFNECLKR